MTYTLTKNEQFDSIEILFDGKPSEAIREALKALKFRWHGVKKIWYGYAEEETVRKAIESGKADQTATKAPRQAKKAEAVNKFGVKVGDIFHSSWGYEQTQNDFFQVVELVGSQSVRVVQVDPPMISRSPVSSMAEDRTFKVTGELFPHSSHSVFIKDQDKGDLKRLKSYAADGKSNPLFNLSSFANAYYCGSDTVKVYESWYY